MTRTESARALWWWPCCWLVGLVLLSCGAPSAANTPGAATGGTAAQPSAAVLAYLDYTQPRMQLVGASMKQLSEQWQRAGDDPALMNDPTWQRETASVLATLKTTGTDLQRYGSVAPDLQPRNKLYVSIGEDLVFIADEYAQGMESGDVAHIATATQRLQALPTKTQQASAELDVLARKYSR